MRLKWRALASAVAMIGVCWGEAETGDRRSFPFPMEGEGLWRIWDASQRRPAAGSGGFIQARGNNFVDAQGKVCRFLGVNLYGPAQVCDKAPAGRRVADRVHFSGLPLVDYPLALVDRGVIGN